MTVITAETSPTAAITVPSKSEFHVFTGSFVGKFMVYNDLSCLEGWIETFETHELNVHCVKTIVAVDINLFSRKIHLSLGYFIITNTTNFEPNSSKIHQMA